MEDVQKMTDNIIWLRCNDCGYETTEELTEVCDRCNKVFCSPCWYNKGYIDLSGEYFGGGGTGYICEKCTLEIKTPHKIT